MIFVSHYVILSCFLFSLFMVLVRCDLHTYFYVYFIYEFLFFVLNMWNIINEMHNFSIIRSIRKKGVKTAKITHFVIVF